MALGGRELWNSIISKVDEDRKLDGSHLTQKAEHYRARDGEAYLCIIDELSSFQSGAETCAG